MRGRPTSKHRVAIVHLDILHAWVDTLIDWGADTAVFDEIHEIQGERARRTAAARQLASACSVRIGLTGTPLPNKPKDLFQTFSILSPGRFGEKFFGFGLRYCAGHQVQVTMDKVVYDWSGRSNEKELRRRLRYCLLRRTKAEVQQDLPPVIREVVDVKLPAKACLNLNATMMKRASIARQALALSANAKLPVVIESVKSHLKAGRKVVVFSHRRAITEHIADAVRSAGFKAAVVHGEVPKNKRDVRIAEVKDAEGGYLLACTFDTCSTGIDLSFASVAVIAEFSYEPHVILQAMSRLHRPGQLLTVIIQFFVGRGSIDDVVIAMITAKLDAFEAYVGDVGDTLASDLDTMPKGRAALDDLFNTIYAQQKDSQ